jgi:phenol 2-monooxygenase
MQFHLDGFQVGDPDLAPASVGRISAAAALPPEVDVLIVGCGPAGLTLAAQLSAFPGIRTAIVERKTGPLELGQADGVACRTMEMFNAFGFAERVMREAYWVNETAFWGPDPVTGARLARKARVQDTEDGLSEFPHVILNQARVHDFYLDVMRRSPHRMEPFYGRNVLGVTVDRDAADYPVEVTLERLAGDQEGQREKVRAKYVVGCDGARSTVRNAMGLSLQGDSANQAWGVMDVLAVTDFPDVRLKTVVNSADGAFLIIPREGGYLIRIYVELEKLAEGQRIADRGITVEDVIAQAQRVLQPYKLEVKEVAWWSAYEIGQRLCERFDDVPAEEVGSRQPRVFIAGDACHTHSPKAGQGMNVSMQDAFNLGWKLASVLTGRAQPELLATYSAERHAIATELIEFDRQWARIISAPTRNPDDPTSEGVDPGEVQSYFVRSGRYTAGTATHYQPSALTRATPHQHLAQGFVAGTRFHSAPVVRLADAKPMHLGHVVKADGRWRLFAFAGQGDAGQAGSPIWSLCDFLQNASESPVRLYTPAGSDIDSVIDVRAVFQQRHRELRVDQMPSLLVPAKGRYGLVDYEKVFAPDLSEGRDIFDLRGIDRAQGCLVVVRPDQYVAAVMPLDAYGELATYLGRFMGKSSLPSESA